MWQEKEGEHFLISLSYHKASDSPLMQSPLSKNTLLRKRIRSFSTILLFSFSFFFLTTYVQRRFILIPCNGSLERSREGCPLADSSTLSTSGLILNSWLYHSRFPKNKRTLVKPLFTSSLVNLYFNWKK